MTSMIEKMSDAVRTAFGLAGFDPELGRVTVSNRPDLCEFQCNGAMAGAKKYGQKPIDIANAVAEQLKNMKYGEALIFSGVEAVMPGFLNLRLSDATIQSFLNEMNFEAQMGFPKCTEKREKLIVDYGGANVAKPLHVGHLRSAVIGEALKRMAIRMGVDAVGDVHLGDWGLQMGLIINELEERGQDPETLDITALEEIYPFASRKAKERDADGNPVHPEYAERAHQITRQLQEGNPEYRKIWEKIMGISLKDLRKNYDSLDVHFELWKGESDAQPYIPGLIRELQEKGLAYRSEGALVVDITEPTDKKELPPCMIQKSDGAALYATSDLGTILDREKNLRPDNYLYIADSRQSLHYTQFFRVAKKAGFVRPETELRYIGFGTMNGSDGKPFKTREGGVLRLEKLVAETNAKVLERIRVSRDDISEREATESSRIIALAALKYGDLSNQATKDYVFDLDKFISFEGNTGPYILYTIVRIGSVLRKYKEQHGEKFTTMEELAEKEATEFQIKTIPGKIGRRLQILLSLYQDSMTDAWKEMAPHKICTYIYELSNAFNSFYHEVKILSEENEKTQKSYLGTLILSWKVLTDAIHTLGFSAPEKM